MRFEPPDSRNRWDSPLFTVQVKDERNVRTLLQDTPLGFFLLLSAVIFSNVFHPVTILVIVIFMYKLPGCFIFQFIRLVTLFHLMQFMMQ